MSGEPITDAMLIAIGVWATGAAWFIWQVYRAPPAPPPDEHQSEESGCLE